MPTDVLVRLQQTLPVLRPAEARIARAVLADPTTAVDGSDDGGRGGADVVTRLAFHATRTIEETARLLDLEALERAAQANAAASRVGVFGTGSSGLSGQALALRLARVGVMTTAPSDRHVQRTHAALLSVGDVAVGISHSGATADPVAALGHARTRGAGRRGQLPDGPGGAGAGRARGGRRLVVGR